MSKCLGCGSLLTNKIDSVGYTNNLENKLCERCFRIRNYNEYKQVIKSNDEYLNIIKGIKKDLVVLVIDLFDIPDNIDEITNLINSDIILVLTKFDLIPSNYTDKFINYFKNNYHMNIVDIVVVSSKNNYGLDDLYNMINNYKVSDKVYFVGYTNAGKSSLINKIIYNYSDSDTVITTSNLPSTTLDTIEIKLNDITLIDTPGIINNGSIINYIDSDLLKRIIPSSKIKPITYQIKTNQSIVIDKIFKINCENNNSLTFYISNKLKIERYYKDINYDNLEKKRIKVDNDSDLVISGLGFIHVIKSDEFDIFCLSNVKIYTRKSIM